MTTAHPTRKLGKRAPKQAPALLAGRFLIPGGVPVHPQAIDNFTEVSDWGLYANDKYGDCGPTSVGNQRKLVTRYLGTAEKSPSQDDVFDLYRRSGNPGFNPDTDADDNGVDMQTMLEAVQSGGIGGTKCVAFAKVDHTNLDEIRAAIAVFGSVLLGVTLDTAQQTQTDRGLWDYAPSSVWGGHAILAGRYTSAKTGDDLAVITWAEVVGLTTAFEQHQLDEAWVVIWPEHLGTVEFQTGVDVATLAADFAALTGRTFPVPVAPVVPPAPAPVPAPGPAPVVTADADFAAVLHPWVLERHVTENHRVAVAAKAWLAAREL